MINNQELTEYLLSRYKQLEQLRAPWEKYWEEIRKYVFPSHNDLNFSDKGSDSKRRAKIFDSTAPLALERFAASIDSMLTPRSQFWHSLKASNQALNAIPEVKIWFEQVTDLLFQKRYLPCANFASQQHEVYLSLGAFGTSCLFVEEGKDNELNYRAIPLSNIYLAENNHGKIDTIFRKFSLTARQSAKQWPNLVLPDKIRTAIKENPEQSFNFLHCVFPFSEISTAKNDYISVYLALEDKEIIETGNYKSFPYIVSRYLTISGEIYGRSPAMTVLADIKMLNEMEKTQLRAIHQQLLPPLLAPDDGLLRPITITPGAINYGGIDSQGRVLIQPLYSGSKPEIPEAKMAQKRKIIEDAFLVNLFQMLLNDNNMTATEILKRTQEKAMLIAPMLYRQQSENLGPLIARELDILADLDVFPAIPEILVTYNADFTIIYDSPIDHLQQAHKAEGLQNTLLTLTPFLSLALPQGSMVDSRKTRGYRM